MRGEKIKLHNYVLKSTLLYNELDNETRVSGYYIVIEGDELDIEDYQAYIISIKNFEIIKKGKWILNYSIMKLFELVIMWI